MAQLASALAWGARGRQFESGHPDNSGSQLVLYRPADFFASGHVLHIYKKESKTSSSFELLKLKSIVNKVKNAIRWMKHANG